MTTKEKKELKNLKKLYDIAFQDNDWEAAKCYRKQIRKIEEQDRFWDN